MAVPKRKTSPSRRNQRRAHHALKVLYNIGFDLETGRVHLSHCADLKGFYKGKKMIFKRPSPMESTQELVDTPAA